MSCYLCPRACGADRNTGLGACMSDNNIRITRAALHPWEEPCISGKNGSGTVFFSGCALGCVFCQNSKISRGVHGDVVSKDRLFEVFKMLERDGAHNINLVTADHYIPYILPVLKRAKASGFSLPFVLNTSSYLNVKTVAALKDTIDVYLADFKFMSDALAKSYANAEDYPDIAKAAIDKMVQNVGAPVLENGLMVRGVIVRVLVLPDCVIDAKRIIKYLHDRYGDKIYISIMSQYTPVCESIYPELNRRITDREYKSVVNYAASCGVVCGFVQQKSSADTVFIPDFKE